MYLHLYRVVQNHVRDKDISLLDAGCGDSIILDFLRSPRIAYVGIDISKKEILAARAKREMNSSVRLLVGYVENLPFRKSAFSIVLLIEVLEHLVEPVKCLKEVDRTLKTSGRVIVTVPSAFRIGRESVISIIRKIVFSVLDVTPPTRSSFYILKGMKLPHKDFTHSELTNLCRRCRDLKIVHIERFVFAPFIFALRFLPEKAFAPTIPYIERVFQKLPVISSMGTLGCFCWKKREKEKSRNVCHTEQDA